LKDHILACLHHTPSSPSSSDFLFPSADHLRISFDKGVMYLHTTARFNYTSYDVRRQQDILNCHLHPDVMVLADEDDSKHPYWYARVLHILHLNITYDNEDLDDLHHECMDILFVRWFKLDSSTDSIWSVRRCPAVSFLDDEDSLSFGFIDPCDVIRTAHLIPKFSHERSDTESSMLAHQVRKADVWNSYHVNM
jgi:hypothetical protein